MEFFYSKDIQLNLRFFSTLFTNSYRNRAEVLRPQLGSFTSMVEHYRYDESYHSSSPTYFSQHRGYALLGLETNWSDHHLLTGTGLSYDQDGKDVGRGYTIQTQIYANPTISNEWRTNYQLNFEQHWLRPRESKKILFHLDLLWNDSIRISSANIQMNVEHYEKDIPTVIPYRRSEWNGNTSLKILTPIIGKTHFSLESQVDGFRIRQGSLYPSSSQLKHYHTVGIRREKSNPFLLSFYGTGYQVTRLGEHLQQHVSERVHLHTGLTKIPIDSLALSIEGAVTRITTPDTTEYNDRDEVQWNGYLRGVQHFSQHFLVESQLGYVFQHPIYLSRYTSSSNRSIRSYNFGTTLKQFFSNRFTHQVTIEMFSSYILYDFPMQTNESRDLASRRFSLYDWLSVPISRGTIIVHLRNDIEDRGTYFRTNHEVALAEAFHTLTGSFHFETHIQRVPFSFGIHGYSRKPLYYSIFRAKGRYNQNVQTVQGIGPIVEFQHQFTNQWRVYNRTSILFIKQMHRKKETQPTWEFTLSKLW
ncbi:MAG: hypothetical protein N2450_01300 [bacterium]|nr:hypothetical protein [bacterium]